MWCKIATSKVFGFKTGVDCPIDEVVSREERSQAAGHAIKGRAGPTARDITVLSGSDFRIHQIPPSTLQPFAQF
jgi:hypothetical protein